MNFTSHIILHADDDRDDLSLVYDLFQKHATQVKVEQALNGEEVLHCLQKMQKKNTLPCLILLDINMPKMDGKTALRQIKAAKAFEAIPIVLFTTSNSDEDKAFAQKWGADLVTKPVSYQKLEAIIDEFVHRCKTTVAK